MTPLFETLLLIVLAILVVLGICWAFGMFREASKTTQPEEQPELENEPLIIEVKEETEVPVKHYAPLIPSEKTANGKHYTYTILNKWYLAKDGDYYQTIQSMQGSIFYITREGKRRYLSTKEKEQLKEFM